MANLFDMLEAAKIKGSRDGDYFLPHQKGLMVIERLIDLDQANKRTIILVGEVLESNAKVSGAATQPAGTKVKRLYPLSKREWAIDDLKTDIVKICGADPKKMTGEEIKAMMRDCFAVQNAKGEYESSETAALCGVVVTFDTTLNETKKDGSKRTTPIVNVFFGEASGPVDKDGVPTDAHVNSAAKIEARAKAIKEKLAAK